VADKASNPFAMGRVLLGLTRLIETTGCTIILQNHNRKNRGEVAKHDPPELSEVSMSGFMEWARFWILLGARKEWKEDTGEHWLWIRTGGSAGHAGLHHLDVVEGRRSDPGGRKWQVTVLPAVEGQKQAQERKEQAAEARRRERVERAKEKIVEAMGRHPGGETEKVIKDTAGVSGTDAKQAFASLLSDGDILPCDVQRNCRKTPYPGYRLADRPDNPPQR
jgi:hypothetical protein